MSESYKNPKLKLVIGDGYQYIADLPDNSFDVIITDSSDPKGPAVCLFQEKYYKMLEKKLTDKGIICCQAESIWFDLDFIDHLLKINRRIYKKVAYASILTCTYPSGQIGFLICSKDPNVDLTSPQHILEEDKLNLKYYTKDIHKSAYVLPRFVHKRLYGDSKV